MTMQNADTEGRTPALGAAVRQQALLLGVSGRWAYLVLGLVGLLMLIGLSGLPAATSRMLIVSQLALLAGVLWAMMVWFGEGPDRRVYQWSLPVPRGAQDLARVAVGGLYLIGVCAVLGGAGAVAEAVNGTFDRVLTIDMLWWTGFFVTPLIAYFLVTPVVLWSDYSVTRWGFALLFGVGLLAVVLSWQGMEWLASAIGTVFDAEGLGLGAALFDWTLGLFGPVPTGPAWAATVLWAGVGVVLTALTGMYRPDDVRRALGSRA